MSLHHDETVNQAKRRNVPTLQRLRCATAIGLVFARVALSATLGADAYPWGQPQRAADRGSSSGLRPGEILFTDSEAAVLKFDPLSSETTVVAAGGSLVRPCGLALGPDHTVYVADTGCPAVIAINPATGQSAVLAQSEQMGVPYGITVNAVGEIFVANGRAILQIDPVDGATRVVSAGGVLRAPLGVAAGSGRDLFVADAGGAVIRVDLFDGTQTVISSGGRLLSPTAIAVADPRTLYVSDPGCRGILRVDIRTGRQEMITTEGSLAAPFGLVILGKHDLLVSDPDAFELASGLIHIDLRTGVQSRLLTGSGDYVNFRCVALVAEPPQP